MPTRDCPHCGKAVYDQSTQCVYCREPLTPAPQVQTQNQGRYVGRSKVRQGLLCVLLAAVVRYFAGGYSAMQLPFPVQPIVTIYLAPVLLLCGLALTVMGFVMQRKA